MPVLQYLECSKAVEYADIILENPDAYATEINAALVYTAEEKEQFEIKTVLQRFRYTFPLWDKARYGQRLNPHYKFVSNMSQRIGKSLVTYEPTRLL